MVYNGEKTFPRILPDGLILTKDQIIIPPVCRKAILDHLHSGHFGIDKMKSLSRLLCWWPNINDDIKQTAKNCEQCSIGKAKSMHQLQAWPVANSPWQRVHVDYCGPFVGGVYALVIIDAFSKWPEVYFSRNQSAAFTIKALRKTFSREGIPQVMVSDNGGSFTASEMKDWLHSIGCVQVFTAPRHPQSNGQAENFVKTLKSAIGTANPRNLEEMESIADNLLLQYRNAEHATTKHRPAELFKGRVLRNSATMDTAEVWFYKGNGLIPTKGFILQSIGNKMFNILDPEDGSMHRRHVDQVTIVGSSNEDPGSKEREKCDG